MKPLKGIEDWTGSKPPKTDPWDVILWTVGFILFFIVLIVLTSCANLQSIPFSVSYQDDSGEVFTVTTEIPIHHKIHADK